MAKLLKHRARKPVIETATAVGTQTTLDGQLAYRVEVYNSADRKSPSYEVVLGRAEMLNIVQSWIAGEARAAGQQR